MNQLLALLSSLPDLLVVILGFGFIIFVHELGHFLAAKWAGIRVLAFAIGFGTPVVTYRKGLGWSRRSSEGVYRERAATEGVLPGGFTKSGISPTEYRLNWLPLGGYVKMLGQDDLRPDATSPEPDSYQSTKPWRRMIVISAGVVMNVILAAVLFVIVFMWGLKTEPPAVGGVAPGYPAATTLPRNAADLGITEPGLKPGDVVVRVNGRAPEEFSDLVLAAAMSKRNAAVELVVQRRGVTELLTFDIVPRQGDMKLLEMGVFPSVSNTLVDVPKTHPNYDQVDRLLARIGLEGVAPGSQLTAIDGVQVQSAVELTDAVKRSGGRPLMLKFVTPEGARVMREVRPEPELERTQVKLPSEMIVTVEHLLGLTPVMQVAENTFAAGLEAEDVFVRLGNARYPSVPEGMAEIHAHKGKRIEVTVLRKNAEGVTEMVRLEPSPEVRPIGAGQIGFVPESTAKTSTLVSLPPRGLSVHSGKADPQLVERRAAGAGASIEVWKVGEEREIAAAAVVTRPGMRVLAIAGNPVANFAEIREAMLEATRAGLESADESVAVQLVLELPLPAVGGAEAQRPTETVEWVLSRADVQRLHGLGWVSPIDPSIFEPTQFLLKASNPIEALQMGLAKTHRVMMMTYLTFARLFEGTVKVEHLKGPVGIAHMGVRVAERGTIWLLFLMALISVNLAVINFLPLPIVDGGQFIFLVLEQIRGKPVSVAVQNVATVIGLLLIGTMFIVVTFHDIVNLFG
jgi:regulator of sigma E protease